MKESVSVAPPPVVTPSRWKARKPTDTVVDDGPDMNWHSSMLGLWFRRRSTMSPVTGRLFSQKTWAQSACGTFAVVVGSVQRRSWNGRAVPGWAGGALLGLIRTPFGPNSSRISMYLPSGNAVVFQAWWYWPESQSMPLLQ